MMDITFERLSPSPEASSLFTSYDPLTPAKFRCCLRGKNPDNTSATVIAIGVLWQGKPVGLGLASYQKHLFHLEIHHLFVLPEFRLKHIGSSLLAHLEAEGAKLGAKVATLVYSLNDSFTSALEKILLINKWKDKRPFSLRYKYDVPHFHMPWVEKSLLFPSGYEEFYWKDLTIEERERLQGQQKQGAIPSATSPFKDENMIEPLNSLGVRYKGEVVGWMITHRVELDTICYTSMFVQPERNYRGVVMAKLLADSIHLHLASPSHWAILEIPLLLTPQTWVQFAEKRLAPFANQITQSVQAWKDL